MRYRKIAGAAVLLLLCASCAKGSNELFQDARAEDMRLYVYSGGDVEVYQLKTTAVHRTEKANEVIEKLRCVDAEPVVCSSTETVELPIYALSSGTVGEDWFGVAWSNGYLYTADGKVYTFDYDFSKFFKRYECRKMSGGPELESLPCVYYLAQDEEGWDPDLLREVLKYNSAEGIGVSLNERTEDALSLNLINHGSEEWTYDNLYSLQGKLEEKWYYIPTMPGAAEGSPTGLDISIGESVTVTCSLAQYGQLPAGEYRLVMDGSGNGNVYYEFTITK